MNALKILFAKPSQKVRLMKAIAAQKQYVIDLELSKDLVVLEISAAREDLTAMQIRLDGEQAG